MVTDAIKEYMRKYRKDNKEEIHKQRKQYNLENADKIKNSRKLNRAKAKKWDEEHKEEIRVYKREYYKKNKGKIREKLLIYYKENPWMRSYNCARGRCRSGGIYGIKGIKLLITREEIKELWFRDKAYELKRPSIDRINSKGNYEYKNCQFLELSVNSSKREYERKNHG